MTFVGVTFSLLSGVQKITRIRCIGVIGRFQTLFLGGASSLLKKIRRNDLPLLANQITARRHDLDRRRAQPFAARCVSATLRLQSSAAAVSAHPLAGSRSRYFPEQHRSVEPRHRPVSRRLVRALFLGERGR
jgi:hypothetical protein